jgi:hypothetical protein
VRRVRWRRYVHGRVAVEEAVGLEAEPDCRELDYGPVLDACGVEILARVPEHDVCVLYGSIGSGVGRQSGAAWVLVGVVPGGEALARVAQVTPAWPPHARFAIVSRRWGRTLAKE